MEINYTSQQISEIIPQIIPLWSYQEHQLQRSILFPSYSKSIQFVNRIAELAEEKKHHPLIVINFTSIELSLYTHDTNGVTEKDFVLAKEIDTLLKK